MGGWGEEKTPSGRPNNFEGMDPKEINFITHPFWRELERQIEENADFAYVIAKDDKPVAVIVSPVALEQAREQLKILSNVEFKEIALVMDDTYPILSVKDVPDGS